MEILLRGAHDLPEFFLADPAVRHHLDQFFERNVESAHDGRGLLVHLPDLLLQGHLCQQILNSLSLFLCQSHGVPLLFL